MIADTISMIICQLKIVIINITKQSTYLYILGKMSNLLDHPRKYVNNASIFMEKKLPRKTRKFLNNNPSDSKQEKDYMLNFLVRRKNSPVSCNCDLTQCFTSSNFTNFKIKNAKTHKIIDYTGQLEKQLKYFAQTQRANRHLQLESKNKETQKRCKSSKIYSSISHGPSHLSRNAFNRAYNHKVKINGPSYILKIEEQKQNQKKKNNLATSKTDEGKIQKNEKNLFKNNFLSQQTQVQDEQSEKKTSIERNNIVKLWKMKKDTRINLKSANRKKPMNFSREFEYPFEDVIKANSNKFQDPQNEDEDFQCLKRLNTIN